MTWPGLTASVLAGAGSIRHVTRRMMSSTYCIFDGGIKMDIIASIAPKVLYVPKRKTEMEKKIKTMHRKDEGRRKKMDGKENRGERVQREHAYRRWWYRSIDWLTLHPGGEWSGKSK